MASISARVPPRDVPGLSGELLSMWIDQGKRIETVVVCGQVPMMSLSIRLFESDPHPTLPQKGEGPYLNGIARKGEREPTRTCLNLNVTGEAGFTPAV